MKWPHLPWIKKSAALQQARLHYIVGTGDDEHVETIDLVELVDEIERLRSRLEINLKHPTHDGIACRDETIKLQDKRIKELERDLGRLSVAAGRALLWDIAEGSWSLEQSERAALRALLDEIRQKS